MNEHAAIDRRHETCAVVVNWNLADLTARCVRALVADGVPEERVVVVDNGSRDDSVERLTRELPAVRLVRLPDNVGYARASNAGARELQAESYLFVNNDAFVDAPGSVGRLLDALTRVAVGIAVPRLLNDDATLQPSVVPLPSVANALVRATGLSRFVPNHLQPSWSTHWDHAASRAVDAANGTVTAVRGDLWRRLGGYAERELMFSEDLDLCWRARSLGFRTWFEHSATFVHLGNASGGHLGDTRRTELVARADASMIRSQLSPLHAETVIWLLTAGYAARAGIFALARKHGRAATARAWLRGYHGRRRLEHA